MSKWTQDPTYPRIIMDAAGWEGDAATIKARALLARLEAE